MSNLAKAPSKKISLLFSSKTKALICVARIIHVTDNQGFIVEKIVVFSCIFCNFHNQSVGTT